MFSHNRVRVIRELRVIRDNVIRVSHVSRVENIFPSVSGVYTAVYPLYTSYPHSFDWTVWTVWIVYPLFDSQSFAFENLFTVRTETRIQSIQSIQ